VLHCPGDTLREGPGEAGSVRDDGLATSSSSGCSRTPSSSRHRSSMCPACRQRVEESALRCCTFRPRCGSRGRLQGTPRGGGKTWIPSPNSSDSCDGQRERGPRRRPEKSDAKGDKAGARDREHHARSVQG
jgi:hypothetical protein